MPARQRAARITEPCFTGLGTSPESQQPAVVLCSNSTTRSQPGRELGPAGSWGNESDALPGLQQRAKAGICYWEVIFHPHQQIAALEVDQDEVVKKKKNNKKKHHLLSCGTSSTKPGCALQVPLQGLVLPRPGEKEIFCTVICMELVKLPVPAGGSSISSPRG